LLRKRLPGNGIAHLAVLMDSGASSYPSGAELTLGGALVMN
jgi:hypothetical protein